MKFKNVNHYLVTFPGAWHIARPVCDSWLINAGQLMVGLDQKSCPTTISVTIDEADCKLLVGFSIEALGSAESILNFRSYYVGGCCITEYAQILSFDLESPWDVLESDHKFSVLTRSGMPTVISYFTLYLDLFWLRGQVCFGWVFRDQMAALRQCGGIVVPLGQRVVGSIPCFLCTFSVSVLHSFSNIQEWMGRLGYDWPWSVTMKLYKLHLYRKLFHASLLIAKCVFSFFVWNKVVIIFAFFSDQTVFVF